MTDNSAGTPIDGQESVMMHVLELIISPSGATIIVAVLGFIAILILVFSKSARLSNWGIHLPGGSKIERTALPPTGTQVSSPENARDKVAKAPPSSAATTTSPQNEPEVAANADANEEQAPNERSYVFRMFEAAFTKNIKALDDAYLKYSQLPDRKWSDELLQSRYHELRVSAGVNEALHDLERLEREKVDWIEPSYHLATLYQSWDAFDQALHHVGIGLDRAKTPPKRLRMNLLKADVLIKMKNFHDAAKLLQEVYMQCTSNKEKTDVLQKLAEAHETQGNTTGMQLYLELCLQLVPDEKQARFKLAYSYGENENTNILSFYHYNILVRQDNNYPFALNNLGVVLGQFGALGQKIQRWQQALKNDALYPATNIAFALIEAGFYIEARKYIDELPKEHQTDSRAIQVRERIGKKIEKEEEAIEKAENSARIAHDFVRSLVNKDPFGRLDPELVVGKWRSGSQETYQFAIKHESIFGELETTSKRFTLDGKIVGSLLLLNFVEAKRKNYGGLFGVPQEPTLPADEWVDVLSSPKRYQAWFSLKENGELAGITIGEASDVTTLELMKVQ